MSEPLVVIEVNVFVNQVIGLLKCFELLAVDTFGFQNAKEIFCHCIVIAISRLDIDGVIPYSLVRLKYACEVY